MSARSSRFSGFGSSRRRAKAAGAVIACGVMILAGCGGSGGSSADAGATVIRGDVAGTSSVTAVAGVGQVVVTWPESQTSSTQSVTGYEVQVSTDSGGTWAGAGTGCANAATTTSTALTCTATGLADGTYSFRIATLKKNPTTKATKTTDFSTGSTAVTVVTAAGTPAKPTVVAGDSKVTVTVAAGTATDGTLGGAPTSYTVTASPAVSGGTCTVTGASGSCPVTGLTNGTAYTFTATAKNTPVDSLASSPSATVTPIGAPGQPGIGAVSSTGPTNATVTFTAPSTDGGSPITRYTATSSPAGGTGTLSQAGSGQITVTGLTVGTSYTFTVTATNAKDTSAASAASAPVTPVALNTLTVSNTNLINIWTLGNNIELFHSGGSGTGAVAFTVTGTGCSVIKVGNGKLKMTQVGDCFVTATRAASTGYPSATSATKTFTFIEGVTQDTLTVSNSKSSGLAYKWIALTWSGGSGEGEVSFTARGDGCEMSGNSLRGLYVTTCYVTAKKAASGDYKQAFSAEKTFAIV